MNKKILLAGFLVSVMLLVPINSAYSNIGIQIDNKPIIQSYRGNTLYVGGSGGDNYTTIQSAIDDASDGNTVFVYDDSSPYIERIQIDKSINLIGEDRNTTIIDANMSGNAISIISDNVSIYELTIQNSNECGVIIDKSFGFCIISDCNINDNIRGVSMPWSGDNNTIENNIFYDNEEWTINGLDTHNNKIIGNIIDHLSGTYHLTGVLLHTCTGNNISNNIIKDCLNGISLEDGSDNNAVLNNIIRSGEYNGISISESSNNKIIGNNISYNLYWGIEIDVDSNDNIIYHNNIEYNYENAIDEGDNIWDDGEFGNYWSDYEQKYPKAKKKPKEGIWDTPYDIDGGSNKDNCPLIKPWPKIKSKDISYNRSISNSLLLRFLERFPLLNQFLQRLICL
jgi:parallel beta-helix repeat protein